VRATSTSRAQLGVALDGTLLTTSWRTERAASWRTHVVACDGTAPSIAAALDEVAHLVTVNVDVAFTLLRPLATSRRVALPAMKRDDAESVLARDWTRYAIGWRAEHHVASARRTRDAWRAAFAPAATLDALDAAARTHGWSVRDVRTADDALAAAARAALPAIARMDDAVVVLCGASGATDLVRLRLGEPVIGRQSRDGTSAQVAAFASDRNATPAMILLLGDAERADLLARELGLAGLRAQRASLPSVAGESPATFLASAALLGRAALPLVAPAERVARIARSKLAMRWLAGAAVLLAVLGAVIENRHTARELAAVARARAAIATQVNDAIARRTRLESATEAATALAAHEQSASRASAALAALVVTLPPNTALSALQISGDSVTIEGESERSAAVYAALRAAPMLEEVRLAGPLRQERQADDETVERFAFVARLKAVQRVGAP
jgi:Tfp pilus assembly protein PilN